MIELLQIVNATLDYFALSLLFALGLAAWWLAPVVFAREQNRYTRVLAVALLLSLVTAGCALLLRTAVMADVTLIQAFEYIPRVLEKSAFGVLWLWRVVVWGLMLLVLIWLWRNTWNKANAVAVFVLAIATALLISVNGHAGEAGLWSLSNLINTVHIVSGLTWGGCVVFYACWVIPTQLRANQQSAVYWAAKRLSVAALLALLLVMLSGLYNGWQQLAAISDLWNTRYGWVLSVKLLLIGLMVVIGTLNFFRWIPLLKPSGDDALATKISVLFCRVLRVDSVVFVAVLLMAAYLSSLPPPVHSEAVL